jgi:hypothetical protein
MKLGVVAHTYNCSTQKSEAGGSQIILLSLCTLRIMYKINSACNKLSLNPFRTHYTPTILAISVHHGCLGTHTLDLLCWLFPLPECYSPDHVMDTTLLSSNLPSTVTSAMQSPRATLSKIASDASHSQSLPCSQSSINLTVNMFIYSPVCLLSLAS